MHKAYSRLRKREKPTPPQPLCFPFRFSAQISLHSVGVPQPFAKGEIMDSNMTTYPGTGPLPTEVWSLCLEYATAETLQKCYRVNRTIRILALDRFTVRAHDEWGFVPDPHLREKRCCLRQLYPKQTNEERELFMRDHLQETNVYELYSHIQRAATCIRDAYPGEVFLQRSLFDRVGGFLRNPNLQALGTNPLSDLEVVEWFFRQPLEKMAQLYSDARFNYYQKIYNDWKAFSVFRKRVTGEGSDEIINESIQSNVFSFLSKNAALNCKPSIREILDTDWLDSSFFQNLPEGAAETMGQMWGATSLYENQELARALLAHGAPITQEAWQVSLASPMIRSLFVQSLQQNNPHHVQMDQNQPDPDLVAPHPYQRLVSLIEQGDLATLQAANGCYLLINFRCEERPSPLQVAMGQLARAYADPQTPRIELLLRKDIVLSLFPENTIGLNHFVNVRDDETGRTPLHLVKELRSRCQPISLCRDWLGKALFVTGGAFSTIPTLGLILTTMVGVALLIILTVQAIAEASLALLLSGLVLITGIVAILLTPVMILYLVAAAILRVSQIILEPNRQIQERTAPLDEIINKFEECYAMDLPDNQGIRPSDIS